jgi:hypothetical protein
MMVLHPRLQSIEIIFRRKGETALDAATAKKHVQVIAALLAAINEARDGDA